MLFLRRPLTVNKIYFLTCFLGLFLLSVQEVHAQFLRNLLQDDPLDNSFNSRDDRPGVETNEELSYEEIVCRDRETFPTKISEKLFTSYFECIKDLDRIENASYIDLTYRIRRDADRLDLYLSGGRKIYICDGSKRSKYEHDQRKDPDWWMISRTSLSELTCPSDEILIEKID